MMLQKGWILLTGIPMWLFNMFLYFLAIESWIKRPDQIQVQALHSSFLGCGAFFS